MVPGVQAEAVQQDVRERRSNARGAHPDAGALLGRPRAPQTAHRLLLVGGGGGDVMTSIARNGIRTEKEGREATPSAAIIDSQSVRTTEKGGLAVTTWASRSRVASATSSLTR